ncbi:MAG: GtrA family protein [Ruminococcaceae bacterium]|nr:GtrA family protein [Oscillospiraceae bacterium]
MTKIKELIIKYKELIIYVIFGGLTTVVNLVVFTLFGMLLGDERYLITNAIAWFAAVVFAYITNKIWVFESKSWSGKVLLKEIPSFFAARVFSFVLEEAGLFLFVDILSFNEISIKILSFEIGGELIAKVILAVVVVVVNYVLSKLVIFKKK